MRDITSILLERVGNLASQVLQKFLRFGFLGGII